MIVLKVLCRQKPLQWHFGIA